MKNECDVSFDRGTEITSHRRRAQLALIRGISHANVCSGARISDSVRCVSNDCKLDLVGNKENLYAEQYVDEIFVPPKHHGKRLALYEPPYQCCKALCAAQRSCSAFRGRTVFVWVQIQIHVMFKPLQCCAVDNMMLYIHIYLQICAPLPSCNYQQLHLILSPNRYWLQWLICCWMVYSGRKDRWLSARLQ